MKNSIVFAIGIQIYRMLTGEIHPFYDDEGMGSGPFAMQVALLGMRDEPDFQIPIREKFEEKLDAVSKIKGVNPILISVMKGLLRVNPKERLSPSEAYEMLAPTRS
jgi:hypothetical protein